MHNQNNFYLENVHELSQRLKYGSNANANYHSRSQETHRYMFVSLNETIRHVK